MSKLSDAAKTRSYESTLRRDETVKNFMDGESYTINPLDTLKIITASSIFGEPSYYRKSGFRDGFYQVHELLKDHDVLKMFSGESTTQIMENAIDNALTFDFEGTLKWAVELRNNYNMRLNPQIIMVRAAIHPKRKEFTQKTENVFHFYNNQVMVRADDPMAQLSYYIYKNGKKNKMPSVLKRSVAKKLGTLNRYKVAKYKNHELGMINAVRLVHAKSKIIDELMQTGTVQVDSSQKTWENLRSEGKSWMEILSQIEVPHMALLKNLRGVFTEINDIDLCKTYMNQLKNGVLTGRQNPYRYFSALKAIENSSCNHKTIIMDGLEECIDIALKNMPRLKGKTMCLSDNSGSAWGQFTSEYGSMTVAEIDNLSSVITASLSDEGYVGKFGDELKVFPISQRNGILSQAQKITDKNYSDVGGSTEGGIWKFFKNAISKKEYWDNIFIYSDQQAGTGGLYGTYEDKKEYESRRFGCRGMINVFALIQEYRKKVNPKVNIFSVQTAGYDNVLIPEMAYRTSILTGWTGKEAEYASMNISQWDAIENRRNK